MVHRLLSQFQIMRVRITAPYHEVMRPTILVATTHSAWEAKDFEEETEKFHIAATDTVHLRFNDVKAAV